MQYFSLEEQLTKLTAALKEQYPRHCFIKINDQKTQPMLVPFVQSRYTPDENLDWYRNHLYTKAHALPVAEVDRLIEAQETALLQAAPATIDITPADEPSLAAPEPEATPLPRRTARSKKGSEPPPLWER